MTQSTYNTIFSVVINSRCKQLFNGHFIVESRSLQFSFVSLFFALYLNQFAGASVKWH